MGSLKKELLLLLHDYYDFQLFVHDDTMGSRYRLPRLPRYQYYPIFSKQLHWGLDIPRPLHGYLQDKFLYGACEKMHALESVIWSGDLIGV
jgi:hypothetical protein